MIVIFHLVLFGAIVVWDLMLSDRHAGEFWIALLFLLHITRLI